LRLHPLAGRHTTVKTFIGKKQPKRGLLSFDGRQTDEGKMDVGEFLPSLFQSSAAQRIFSRT